MLQRVCHKRLGEVLISMEALDPGRLMQALGVQRELTLRLTSGFVGKTAITEPATLRLVRD